MQNNSYIKISLDVLCAAVFALGTFNLDIRMRERVVNEYFHKFVTILVCHICGRFDKSCYRKFHCLACGVAVAATQ